MKNWIYLFIIALSLSKIYSLELRKTDAKETKDAIKLHYKMDNKTAYKGEKVTFTCDISGKPSPMITWSKGRLILTDIKMKLYIKTKHWGSQLKLMDVDFSDEGWYHCKGENGAGIRNTSAYLKVLEKQPQENDEEDDGTSDNDNQINKEVEKGYCQTFQGSTCGSYLSNRQVYVSHGLVQSRKERRIAELISEISSMLASQADHECLRHLVRLTCYHHFRICDKSNKKPRNVCRKDCQSITKNRCNYTYKLMLQKLRSNHLKMVPDCEGLNDGPNCFAFSEIPAPSQKLPTVAPFKPKPAIEEECYNGTGIDYSGTLAITNKDNPCIEWKKIKGFEKYPSNYCRNPKLSQIPNASGPWCFTNIAGDWEVCKMRRCEGDISSNKTETNLLPIYIAISSVVGFVFLLIFVCWICRRSYLGHYKPCYGSEYKKTENPVMQLNKMKINCNDYPLSQIKFQEQLGEGVFGPVYKAELLGTYSNGGISHSNSNTGTNQSNSTTTNNNTSNKQMVVVKTLSAGSSLSLQRDFRREAQMMTELRHVNVLGLVGVSMRQIPWCLIFDCCGDRDLHELLISCSGGGHGGGGGGAGGSTGTTNGATTLEAHSVSTFRADSMDAYGDVSLSFSDQVFIAAQIASGMEYLASRSFVHRDLAARNVQVGDNLLCRISDLGLVRERYSSDYYRAPGSSLMLPIRWMSPEAVEQGQFTVESDVWSFGVLLWEIWAGGLQPFYGHSNAEVVELVRRGRQVLPRPEGCPNGVRDLMLECWNELPRYRPQFKNIHSRLRLWQQEAASVAVGNCSSGMMASPPGGPSMGMLTAGGGLDITMGTALLNSGLMMQQAPMTTHHHQFPPHHMSYPPPPLPLATIPTNGGSQSGGSHSRHTTSSTEMCSDHSNGGGNSSPPPPPPPLQPPPPLPGCSGSSDTSCHTTTSFGINHNTSNGGLMNGGGCGTSGHNSSSHNTTSPLLPPPSSTTTISSSFNDNSTQPYMISQAHTCTSPPSLYTTTNNNYLPELSHIV